MATNFSEMAWKLWAQLRFCSQKQSGWAGIGAHAALMLQSLLTHGSAHSSKRSDFKTTQRLKMLKMILGFGNYFCRWASDATMTPSIFVKCQRFCLGPSFPNRQGYGHTTVLNRSPTPLTKWMNHAKWAKHVYTDWFLETQGLKWLKHAMRWWVTQIHLRQQKTHKKTQNKTE